MAANFTYRLRTKESPLKCEPFNGIELSPQVIIIIILYITTTISFQINFTTLSSTDSSSDKMMI